ncbi:MAG: hypothetical protein ACRD2X_16575, partial [Vicinamibacteraceae bacterium]
MVDRVDDDRDRRSQDRDQRSRVSALSNALTFELGLPSARYETRAEAQAFHLRALERLRGLPGVRSVGA